MTTDATYEERGSDWSRQVSAVVTIQLLQHNQTLSLCEGCGLRDYVRVWLHGTIPNQPKHGSGHFKLYFCFWFYNFPATMYADSTSYSFPATMCAGSTSYNFPNSTPAKGLITEKTPYEISKSWDFGKDFRISGKISRFQERFEDIKISLRFQDFT